MVAYSFYRFDVTPLLQPEGNILRVEIQDMNLAFGPSEGWENYGGIIRDVYLTVTDKVMVEDVIWRTAVSDDLSEALCTVDAVLDGGDADVCITLRDHFGAAVHRVTVASADGKAVLTFPVVHPQLWSPDMPCLYTLTVSAGGDEVQERVGIKDFRAVGQRFVLNGKPLYLKGVCRHDLYGDEGHTITQEHAEADLRLIKATGCNFVRLVHYPHDRRILELADEIGETLETVLETLEMQGALSPISLDASTVSEDEDFNLHSVLGFEERGYGDIETKDMILRALKQMTDTEKTIIMERFFNNRSQRDVADMLGVSQMTVSRNERKAIERFRQLIEG